MTTIGAAATDWTNDNLFGDGFFIGSDGGYGDADEAYAGALEVVNGFISYEADQGMDTSAVEAAIDSEADDYDPAAAAAAVNAFVAQVDPSTEATYLVEDEETLATEETTASYADLTDAVAALSELVMKLRIRQHMAHLSAVFLMQSAACLKMQTVLNGFRV